MVGAAAVIWKAFAPGTTHASALPLMPAVESVSPPWMSNQTWPGSAVGQANPSLTAPLETSTWVSARVAPRSSSSGVVAGHVEGDLACGVGVMDPGERRADGQAVDRAEFGCVSCVVNLQRPVPAVLDGAADGDGEGGRAGAENRRAADAQAGAGGQGDGAAALDGGTPSATTASAPSVRSARRRACRRFVGQ